MITKELNIQVDQDETYWIFENGNKYTKAYYSLEDAIDLNATLENCVDCIDCKGCNDCVDCIDCDNCYDCINCSKCHSCKDCYNSDDCINETSISCTNGAVI